jgi:hypothetical protein
VVERVSPRADGQGEKKGCDGEPEIQRMAPMAASHAGLGAPDQCAATGRRGAEGARRIVPLDVDAMPEEAAAVWRRCSAILAI